MIKKGTIARWGGRVEGVQSACAESGMRKARRSTHERTSAALVMVKHTEQRGRGSSHICMPFGSAQMSM